MPRSQNLERNLGSYKAVQKQTTGGAITIHTTHQGTSASLFILLPKKHDTKKRLQKSWKNYQKFALVFLLQSQSPWSVGIRRLYPEELSTYPKTLKTSPLHRVLIEIYGNISLFNSIIIQFFCKLGNLQK